MTVETLTTQEQAAIDAIRRLVNERGYPPTGQELGDLIGLRSKSSVHYLLARLERKGAIRRGTGPRAITIVGGA